MPRALILRHTPQEGVAGFREPIEAAGYTLDRATAVDGTLAQVDLLAPDLLVVMGGPMGVYEADAHPWIRDELAGIAARIAAGKATLGVCLGAQMIAGALGMPVYPGPAKELGFAPLTLTAAGERSPLRHLRDVPVLHWHGDTFDLPPGGTLLASTPSYRNQAFAVGTKVLALQCHPEMGEDPRIEHWIAQDAADLCGAGWTADRMRRAYAEQGPPAVAAGRAVVAEWLAGLG